MANFCLQDSDKYYLSLSEQPKRFDPNSPVTNVFFDDTNGQARNHIIHPIFLAIVDK